jgi:hypothetical protein
LAVGKARGCWRSHSFLLWMLVLDYLCLCSSGWC